MKFDFTLSAYENLVRAAIGANYKFFTLHDYLDVKRPKDKIIILRHDVDKYPKNALRFAEFENKMKIRSTFYFRIKNTSFDKNIIKKISTLGHEIGYHYEDLTEAGGDLDLAITLFEKNLEILRNYYPVKTICMHGRPLSKINNHDIWKKFDYHDFGIIGEPYFDLDYNKILYLTDTGRNWEPTRGNIRDKVQSKIRLSFRSTWHLIKSIDSGGFSREVILNTHPQRWNDNLFLWMKELVSQNLKNGVKRMFMFRG